MQLNFTKEQLDALLTEVRQPFVKDGDKMHMYFDGISVEMHNKKIRIALLFEGDVVSFLDSDVDLKRGEGIKLSGLSGFMQVFKG